MVLLEKGYTGNKGPGGFYENKVVDGEEITEAYEFADKNNLTPPTMEQPQYNLLDRKRFEIEYEPIFKKFGMGTTIWSPLASGALTGKYLEGIPEGSRASLKGYEWLKKHMIESDRGQTRMKKIAELMPIAQELGESLSKIAIAWCLLNENVSTIILGASKIEQLEENLKAPEILPLLTKEIQQENIKRVKKLNKLKNRI